MARSKTRDDGSQRTERVIVYLSPDEKERFGEMCGLVPQAVQARQLILDWMDEDEG